LLEKEASVGMRAIKYVSLGFPKITVGKKDPQEYFHWEPN
jgi:hypothetical protein